MSLHLGAARDTTELCALNLSPKQTDLKEVQLQGKRLQDRQMFEQDTANFSLQVSRDTGVDRRRCCWLS